MDIKLLQQPDNAIAHVTMNAGEELLAEAGAMIAMSSQMNTSTTLRQGKGGGVTIVVILCLVVVLIGGIWLAVSKSQNNHRKGAHTKQYETNKSYYLRHRAIASEYLQASKTESTTFELGCKIYKKYQVLSIKGVTDKDLQELHKASLALFKAMCETETRAKNAMTKDALNGTLENQTALTILEEGSL